MKQFSIFGALACALAMAGLASAAPVYVAPSTVGVTTFDGTYNMGDTDNDPNTPDQTGTQEGYILVDTDNPGVEACNGNQEHAPADESLQGYIWVGAGREANRPAGQTPGGEAGVGHTEGDTDGDGVNESPCPHGENGSGGG